MPAACASASARPTDGAAPGSRPSAQVPAQEGQRGVVLAQAPPRVGRGEGARDRGVGPAQGPPALRGLLEVLGRLRPRRQVEQGHAPLVEGGEATRRAHLGRPPGQRPVGVHEGPVGRALDRGRPRRRAPRSRRRPRRRRRRRRAAAAPRGSRPSCGPRPGPPRAGGAARPRRAPRRGPPPTTRSRKRQRGPGGPSSSSRMPAAVSDDSARSTCDASMRHTRARSCALVGVPRHRGPPRRSRAPAGRPDPAAPAPSARGRRGWAAGRRRRATGGPRAPAARSARGARRPARPRPRRPRARASGEAPRARRVASSGERRSSTSVRVSATTSGRS